LPELSVDLSPLIKIRVAELSDSDIIFHNEHQAYEIPWSENLLIDCLTGDYVCFLMVLQNKTVGHMIFQQVLDEIHLQNVCIIPDLQNKGLGHYWLDYLENYARIHQVRDIILEVRASNLVAKKLYAKRGYREIGLRKAYYQSRSGREDGLVMKARIE